MTEETNSLFDYSALANAAYITLDDYPSITDELLIERAIIQGILPESLGNDLFLYDSIDNPDAWQIPEGGYYTEHETGFAATLFDNGTEKVLAIRGTELGGAQTYLDAVQADLIQLGFYGFALEQTVSMMNYIMRLSTPVDEYAKQFRITLSSEAEGELSGIPIPVDDKTLYLNIDVITEENGLGFSGLGLLDAADQVTVVGHSLGGHLSAMAARLFPGMIDQSYTFNSPGFDPEYSTELMAVLEIVSLGKTLLQKLGGSTLNEFIDDLFSGITSPAGLYELKLTEPFVNSVAQYLPQLPATSFIDANIYSYEAESFLPGDDISLLSGLLTNQEVSLGPVENIALEGNTHSISALMDTLALQSLLLSLDNAFVFPDMAKIYSLSANTPGESEEGILTALHRLFVTDQEKSALIDQLNTLDVEKTSILGVETGIDLGFIYSASIADRDTYYRLIHDVRNSDLYAQASGAVNIFTLAYESIDGGLVPRSSQDLQSRAGTEVNGGIAYRYALKNLNPFVILGDDAIYAPHNANGELDLYDPISAPDGMTDEYIADRATMLHLVLQRNLDDTPVQSSTGYGENDTTYEDLASHTVFTTSPYAGLLLSDRDLEKTLNNQIIFGSDMDDNNANSISGGINSDRLYGMGGHDELYGYGANDYIEGNSGNDRIIGGIGDDELNGGTGFDYYRYSAGDGNDVITDTDEDDGFKAGRINHFSASGDLVTQINGGIQQETPNTWVGIGGDVVYQLFGTSDNALLITFLGESGSITLKDFHNGDLGITLKSLNNNDAPVTSNTILDDLNGPATNEYLHGSEGNDYIRSGYGADHLIGYGGNDILEGGDHSDELLGGEGNDLLMGGDGGDLIQGENGYDHLQGNTGDDLLFSWNAFLYREDEAFRQGDIIEGGPGSDVLQGSIGDDELYAGQKTDLYQALNSDTTVASIYERDFLSGGDGDDLLVGSAGHDYLGGANGNDYLVGGAGNDIILGDYELRSNSLDWNVYQNNTYFINYENVVRQSLAGSGNDQIHAGGGDDLVHGNRGDDVIYGNAGRDVLRGGDGSDYLYGGEGDDILWGENHDDVIHGGLGNDELSGQGGNDDIFGNEGDDKLYGHAGDDRLYGGEGADYLRGFAGNDAWFGGLGNDYYHFYAVDGGMDRIQDEGGNDIVQISDVGVTYDSIVVTRAANDLGIQLNATDSITIDSWFLAPEYQIETFRLYTTSYTGEEIESLIYRPRLMKPVADINIDQGQVFELTLPDAMFVDLDDDYLDIDVRSIGQDMLPSWLYYDQLTQTFTGTPGNADVGIVTLDITATDVSGQSASDRFSLTVRNVNDAPVLYGPIENRLQLEDEPFSFSLAEGTFDDEDIIHGDYLTFNASLAGGEALPDWLNYDSATNVFSGTPENTEVGEYTIGLSAVDVLGASVTGQFVLQVMNVNDAPVVMGSLSDQTATVDDPFSFSINPALFTDDDIIHGDSLAASILRTDGGDLPGWISFDRETWTLSGTPSETDAGILQLQVIATDAAGASAGDYFDLLVQANTIISASGSRDDDVLTGGIYSDTLRGGGGNDQLYAGKADDTLNGGNGDDDLYGGSGDDFIKGAAGNDLLAGESGNDQLNGGRNDDTYLYDAGDGSDVIMDAHGMDTLLFGEDIGSEDIWFAQSGSNLQINILDSIDQIVIENWYKSDNHQVEQFQTHEGGLLLNNQVDQLVQAMAVFDPGMTGEFNPDQSARDQVDQTIAAAWSTA